MLTPDEVADFLKVDVQTVWRWCRQGTLPAVKLGKYWRISRSKLDAHLEAEANRTPAVEEEDE
jgi:excisionase family DNA binding protein